MALIAWILYACFEGYRESLYWRNYINLKYSSRGYVVKTKQYEHQLWTAQRAIVLFTVFLASDLKTVATCMFLFPFLHDGMYYLKRNLLNENIYRKRWFAQSNSSTAVLTRFFNPIIRTLSAIIGIVLYFAL